MRDETRARVAGVQAHIAHVTGITPHNSLVALLQDAGIEAKEEDTGGVCLAVVAPLPEGGEAVMAWEGDEWGVSLSNAEGGCEWTGSVPTMQALVSWVVA